MTPAWTPAELAAYLDRHGADDPAWLDRATRLTTRWHARGDGAAIYENHDLGHPDLGSPQIVSYGSAAAQLETPTPPPVLPDIGGAINWRYVLVATCRPGDTP